jgi:hypothetical protein
MSSGSGLLPVVASTAAVLAVTMAVAALPRSSEPLLVLGPFWKGEAATMRVIAAADARILGRGRFDATVVVAAGQPELVARLYAAGALLVVNGSLFTGCTLP